MSHVCIINYMPASNAFSRGRPRANDADIRRERLFEAARQAFLVQGFQGASLEGIAQQAGISRATIYRQFRSKEKLFREVALHSVDMLRAEARAIPDAGRQPRVVLCDFVMLFAGAVTDERSVGLLRMAISEQPLFPELALEIAGHMQDTLAPLTTYLRRMKQQGLLNFYDVTMAARWLLVMANEGFSFLLVRPQETESARQQRAMAIVEMFLHGLSRHGDNGMLPQQKAP